MKRAFRLGHLSSQNTAVKLFSKTANNIYTTEV
jgi:hypothetical protein